MRSAAALLALLASTVACGGPPASSQPTANAPAAPTLPTGDPTLRDPALQPLAFLVGAWRADDGAVEIWTPAGDALFGVSFPGAGGGFECVILSVVDGAITYRAMPAGKPAVPFVLDAPPLTARDARFTNPMHDDPQVIHYLRQRDQLGARVSRLDGSNAIQFSFTRFAADPAPALADADRQFAADTARDGAAGWARWFAPDGAMLRASERIEGHAAIQALMAPLLDDPAKELRWEPVASGLAPAEDLGFTVGEAHIVDGDQPTWYGAYVTIWQRQADGTWRVRFDTGDDDAVSLTSRGRGDG